MCYTAIFYEHFFAKICINFVIKKYGQKSSVFLTDLDMDTSAYSSNWSVFYTGATQIAEIRKNAFGALGGFLGKIVVKTRGLLQPCTGRYTQFWHIWAKQRTKTADFRHTIRFIIVSEHCPQKTAQSGGAVVLLFLSLFLILHLFTKQL